MINLRQGDCLELMKDIPDKSIDMILCDLPYGTTVCKWDVIIPFDKLWEQYNRIIKDNGAIVLFGSEPFSSYLRLSNIKNYKYDWCWIKSKPSGHLIAKYQPMKKNENIIVFGKKKINYYPILEEKDKKHIRNPKKNYKLKTDLFGQNETILFNQYRKIPLDKKYPDNVLEIKSVGNNGRIHPTQKPVALLEYLIKTYTNENETVLDNCMGSGSTGVACINTNRNFIGIELSEEYYNIAVRRINETKQI